MSSYKRKIVRNRRGVQQPEKDTQEGGSFIIKAAISAIALAAFVVLLFALDSASIKHIRSTIEAKGGKEIRIEHVSGDSSPFINDHARGDNIYKVTYVDANSNAKVIYLKNGDFRDTRE